MIVDIVIGKPLVDPVEVFGLDNPIYMNERYLPKILLQLGIFQSISQIRKNRPDLIRELNDLDFLEIKIGKHMLYILVGE